MSSARCREEGLVRYRELDVDILPKIIHLEALFIIRQDRTHHVLIAVLLFP